MLVKTIALYCIYALTYNSKLLTLYIIHNVFTLKKKTKPLNLPGLSNLSL